MGAEIERRTNPTRGFCLQDYVDLLHNFLRRGYRIVDLDGLIAGQRTLFVRHDVDLSLERAVAVAEAEASENVRASYYLLLSTDMYNIASAEGQRAAKRLSALGHAIGLHFDATRYQAGREGLEAAAQRECNLLEAIAEAPVTSISFHRPAPELVRLEGSFAGRRHCYEPRFFEEVAYISDSSGGFFRGHPLDHPAASEGRAIQLLTHPIWWASPERLAAKDALTSLRQEKRASIDEALEAATAKAPSEFIVTFR
jgi:hypothetical protein